MASLGSVFPQSIIGLVKVAETTGGLVAALGSASTLLESQLELRRRFARALVYPVVALSIFLLIALKQGYASDDFRAKLWLLGMRVPLLRNMLSDFRTADFVLSYGRLLKVGVSTLPALKLCAQSIPYLTLQERIPELVQRLMDGAQHHEYVGSWLSLLVGW